MAKNLLEYEKLKAETISESFKHEVALKGGTFHAREFNRLSAFLKIEVKDKALWQEKTGDETDYEKLAGNFFLS